MDEPPRKIEGLTRRYRGKGGAAAKGTTMPELKAFKERPPKPPKPEPKPRVPPPPKPIPKFFQESPFEPERAPETTNEQLVERMAGIDMKPREIAVVLNIPEKEVNGYKDAIERGAAKAKFKVMNTAWVIATSPQHPKAATMNIFWQKSRYGMSDQPPQTVYGGNDADASHLTDDTVAERFEATLAALRK